MDNVEGIVCLEAKKKTRGEDGVTMPSENVMLGSMYHAATTATTPMRDPACTIAENRNSP